MLKGSTELVHRALQSSKTQEYSVRLPNASAATVWVWVLPEINWNAISQLLVSSPLTPGVGIIQPNQNSLAAYPARHHNSIRAAGSSLKDRSYVCVCFLAFFVLSGGFSFPCLPSEHVLSAWGSAGHSLREWAPSLVNQGLGLAVRGLSLRGLHSDGLPLMEPEWGLTSVPTTSYHPPANLHLSWVAPHFNFSPFPEVPQLQGFGEVATLILKKVTPLR